MKRLHNGSFLQVSGLRAVYDLSELRREQKNLERDLGED